MARRRKTPAPSASGGSGALVLGLAILVALAIVRSAWATRHDGFTIDEPYHLVAGAAYARLGDYRLNPEHPPLVKLWLGTVIPAGVLPVPPLRPLFEKPDERAFAEGAVYTDADPAVVRSQARTAMLVLNGALLLLLGLALRREMGGAPALLSILFLAIDPTVAAHMPVAMTDLPVALLSALAVLTGYRAVRTTRPLDVLLACLALGGALGTKHSGLVAAAVVFGLSAFEVLRARAEAPSRGRRAAAAGLVLVGAWVLLWGLYGFRFHESGGTGDAFNRPLAAKLEDVGSPVVRGGLRAAETWRLLPRPYVWGLADVMRSAVEGRSFPLYAFGELRSTTPAWYFPAVLGVKLPLGLLALSVGGLAWAAAGRAARGSSRNAILPLGVAGAAFLATLAVSRAGYAGVRHALPVVPAFAALAGAAAADLGTRDRRVRVFVAGLFVAAAVPALLVPRPWEFHNVLAGGTAGAWKRFNNEGVDLGQRSLELAGYEREVLRPVGVVPYVVYPMSPELVVRVGLRARPWRSADGSGTLTGTFLVSAVELAPSRAWDYEPFRLVEPVDRRGNLLVYRGTFRLPWLRARDLYFEGLAFAHGPVRDASKARDRFAESARLHPGMWVSALEQGNLELELGRPVEAAAAWEAALAAVPGDETSVRAALKDGIGQLRRSPGNPPRPIRNPWLE
jgi:hypothetical protein